MCSEYNSCGGELLILVDMYLTINRKVRVLNVFRRIFLSPFVIYISAEKVKNEIF